MCEDALRLDATCIFCVGDSVPYQPKYRPHLLSQSLIYKTQQILRSRKHKLDSIPGLLLFIALIFGMSGLIWFPATLLYITAIIASYSVFRFMLLAVAHVQGLQRIYQAELKKYDVLADVHHVVILPNYSEPINILRRTLHNLAGCSGAIDTISVILAMEADEASSKQKAKTLQAEFGNRFANFFYSIHPCNLPGEIQCKSSNQAWAVRWIRRELVEYRGYNPSNIIVTTMDADTIWHSQYFAALASNFMQDPNRYTRIWQAPIRYHGNIYGINPILRLTNVYSTAVELGYLSASWWESLPISSYSLSLCLLERSNYWDTNVIADEWRMYINAYFAVNGQVRITPIYLPFIATIVTGNTFWDAVKNRYKQMVRHSWGSKEIGYTVGRIIDEGAWYGIRLLIAVAHDLILASAGTILLIFGAQLTLIFHPELRSLSNPAFVLLQVGFIMTLFLGMFFLVLDIRTRPVRPSPPTGKEHILTIIGFLLLPTLSFIFVVFPLIHAQIMLLFGIPISFQIASKE